MIHTRNNDGVSDNDATPDEECDDAKSAGTETPSVEKERISERDNPEEEGHKGQKRVLRNFQAAVDDLIETSSDLVGVDRLDRDPAQRSDQQVDVSPDEIVAAAEEFLKAANATKESEEVAAAAGPAKTVDGGEKGRTILLLTVCAACIELNQYRGRFDTCGYALPLCEESHYFF